MDTNELLLSNGFVRVPLSRVHGRDRIDHSALGTVVANFAYYGYVISSEVLNRLLDLDEIELADFWQGVEPALKKITGADRQIGDFVVYKNFPKEVLEKSVAEYWIAQILMYWGLPNELFAQEEEERIALSEQASLRVLAMGEDGFEAVIWNRLVRLPARWTDAQKEQALFILKKFPAAVVDFQKFSFRENAVVAAATVFPRPSVIKNATDVLRLAASLSEGDVSLRAKTRFRKFKRSERRVLLRMLEKTNHIENDFALRPETWKRLLAILNPSDASRNIVYTRTLAAYDRLYRGDLRTQASIIEAGIEKADPSIFETLRQHPGDFLRRFHKLYAVFGSKATLEFVSVIDQLKTIQLVRIDRYLATINTRASLIYPPRGNWARAQVAPNEKMKIVVNDVALLRKTISNAIAARLSASYPGGFDIDPMVENVKLQTNDQKLAPYGRGTVFDIPENMTFIRSASYWECKNYENVWFDNGWNFFNDAWASVGTCCWNDTHGISGATFSGDPTNSKDLKGRACQMIDLDLAVLKNAGVRYAVWNILCYSHTPFLEARDVLATFQWGESAQSGKLYEPSRAQMVFPIKDDSLTKYVAYVDLEKRELVYIDANFGGRVDSAKENTKRLEKNMPAYVDYLNSLPSVADVFMHGQRGSTPVMYSDADRKITGGSAYVFQRNNATNIFDAVEIESLLAE